MGAYILIALSFAAISWLAWELRKSVAELGRLRAELDNRLVGMQAEVSRAEKRVAERIDEHDTLLSGIKAKFDAQKAAEKRSPRWPRMS